MSDEKLEPNSYVKLPPRPDNFVMAYIEELFGPSVAICSYSLEKHGATNILTCVGFINANWPDSLPLWTDFELKNAPVRWTDEFLTNNGFVLCNGSSWAIGS